MTLEAGDSLGRYRIERRIGAGAMGEVYLARDPHIERQLALKTVRIGDSSAAEIEDRRVRMLREAKAAGRLVHPHVVTLFDAGESGGVFYLAFEYVAGPDLAGRQRLPPPLTLGEVLRIGRQSAEGLEAAHRQGIVHRDIKPSNILLDSQGQVKISDFGIAKMLGQGTELTQTGSVVGSPHYLSPEQIRGEELDGRSDLFSLGVVLYELLTRHRPFEGDTITTLVYQILAREPQPIAGLRPGLPEHVERIVLRMLHKDRDQRFATAREVADEVAACEREVSPAALGAPAAPLPRDVDETVRLPSTPPTPTPTRLEVTGPTRLSTPPPLPPAPAAAADATAPTRRSTLPPVPVPPVPAEAGSKRATAPTTAASGGTTAVPPAAQALAATAPPRRFPWAVVAVVLVLGLVVTVGAVGGLFWLRGGFGKSKPPVAEPTQVAQEGNVPAALPASDRPTSEPPPFPAATAEEVSEPSPRPSVTADSEPVAPEPAPTRVAVPAPTTYRPPPPARVQPASPRETTAPEPVETRRPPPTPAPTRAVPPVHNLPAPTPPPPDPEPAVPEQRYDQEISSTLALKFKVEPEDTVVSFKEEGERRFTVIGRAGDYSAEKKKLPPFTLPGEGIFYLRLYAEGREVIYRLDAHQGAQPTVISQVLIAKPGRRR